MVEQKTGVQQRRQCNIWKKAKDRGFEPNKDPRILEVYIVDGKRSGRPKEILRDQEEDLLSSIRSNRVDREKSSEVLCQPKCTATCAILEPRQYLRHTATPNTPQLAPTQLVDED